jgi:hypothetical protein
MFDVIIRDNRTHKQGFINSEFQRERIVSTIKIHKNHIDEIINMVFIFINRGLSQNKPI